MYFLSIPGDLIDRNEECTFSDLLGLTFVTAESSEKRVDFVADFGARITMYHEQNCCESVYVEDINGDLNDLVGSPILRADERTNVKKYGRDVNEDGDPIGDPPPENDDDYLPELQQWTFYGLSTIKGSVDFRFYGSSNGYYSVSVTTRMVRFTPEVMQFCKEKQITAWLMGNHPNDEDFDHDFVATFQNEEDLLVFKLKFGGDLCKV
jgi:hypothetical protein